MVVAGMIASRLAANAVVESTFTGLPAEMRLLLETLLVATMFGLAGWRCLVVPLQRRHLDGYRSDALTTMPAVRPKTPTRHLALVPPLRTDAR